MANSYNHKKIEEKWIKKWLDAKLYEAKEVPDPNKKEYILPQLPYPSGSGLHVGHAEVYTSCDIYARYQRMKGKDVMQVIGWDSFGLPAESYAIKTNIHPKESTEKAVDNFRYQISRMGCSLDWDREVGSHQPSYYKWTQWFFHLMYDQGLAYRDKQKTNWCSSCKTVLANDQVKEGLCERCDTKVVQKEMDVWFLRITDYADRLAKDLNKVDWPEESIKRQRDWIGKSRGAHIEFLVKLGEELGEDRIEVFTTRVDTIFGVTFMALTPEYESLSNWKEYVDNWNEVSEYIEEAKNKTDLERKQNKEKTGVKIDGITVINPINDEEVPLFVADYVLAEYGEGAVMGVPAHDERDFEFAKKYDLDIIEVVSNEDGENDELFTGYGVLVNSEDYNGMKSKKVMNQIISWLEEHEYGEGSTEYKLRDWSVSRQRFWGAPVPMMYKPLDNEAEQLNKDYLNKPDRVINLHAWDSGFDEHYHPWIDSQLSELVIDSLTPSLPNAKEPKFEEWYEVAEDLFEKDCSENTVITTRSLSSVVALKLAEKYKIRKLVLVSPVLPSEKYIEHVENSVDSNNVDILIKFFNRDLKYKKIVDNVGELVFVLSTDDSYIPLDITEQWIKKKFPFARIMRKRDSGHFDKEHGYAEFPELLDEIVKPVHLGLVRVYDSDLPVRLPDDVDFMPTGRSPLTYSKKFQEGVEEKYGEGWKREVDTLDTFMCSSWYYYRYLDPKNDQEFASEEVLKNWMPVDFYIGGREHVTGHLLYSRFFTKVLYDAGYIDFDEPFKFHRHQGLILAEDGRKMSKRWGNVINPTDVMDRHGADTLRLYEMFMGPLEDQKAWNNNGEKGVYRFISKVWGLKNKVKKVESVEQRREVNKLIEYLDGAIENLKFNTCVSQFMEFVNFLNKEKDIDSKVWKKFLLSFAPFAPFITEELWRDLHGVEYSLEKDSIHMQDWPEKFDVSKKVHSVVELPVQINGKVRGKVMVSKGATKDEVKDLVMKELSDYLEGKDIQKFVYVEGKIISLAVK